MADKVDIELTRLVHALEAAMIVLSGPDLDALHERVEGLGRMQREVGDMIARAKKLRESERKVST